MGFRKKVILLMTLLLCAPAMLAWFYFNASNGERMQWIFGSSCNTASRPLRIVVDSDTPAAFQTKLTESGGVIEQWNNPAGTFINLLDTTIDTATMDASAIAEFSRSPTTNRMWIAYDSTGELIAAQGIDPGTVLGVAFPLTPNASRPQDICAAIIIINGARISTTFATPALGYKKTVLHEVGHALGFAHSVAGANGTTHSLVQINDGTFTGDASKLPVMFPFSLDGTDGNSANPETLNADDQAAAITVYGQ